VFLLGPSHHVYLNNCALSQCTHYRTPIGDLEVDTETVATLFKTGKFGKMTKHVDEGEHSLEMQLPYICKVLSRAFAPEDFPTLVPILVGSTSPEKEREYGALLAPYLEDETSIFVISSDFCHWGLRFGYTYYLPDPSSSSEEGIQLRAKEKLSGAAIYESIDAVDRQAMSCIESGSYDSYIANLQSTGNTVCGQHPIGVVMCALEMLKSASKLGGSSANFKFIRYERSSQCRKVSDSSVSYASAFAVVECKITAGV
jgi:AmmeMemoRadiSam system protein B